MLVPFVDRLVPVMIRGDVDEARILLDSLDGESLREAKDWFAQSKRWVAGMESLPYVGKDDPDYRVTHETFYQAQWIIDMCAVALCGPVTAARRVLWSDHWDHQEHSGQAALVHQLWDADREWARDFVNEAAKISLGGNARNTNWTLSRILRAVLMHHKLPAPRGATFLAAWSAGAGKHDSLTSWLSQDPLMPDLLFHYLASGHCGQTPGLPQATKELTSQGLVARHALLEHVLTLLTSPQRPASQKVLAEVLTALEVTAEEIPGGLTYLLGVLATSHGSVGGCLLPHAIALVTTPEELTDLTIVISGRPEKAQKATLLRAMRSKDLRTRIPVEGILDAMPLLANGADTAFAQRVNRAMSDLAPAGTSDAPTSQPPQPTALGLWDLRPAPAATDTQPRYWTWWEEQATWAEFLHPKHHQDGRREFLVEQALTAMADGSFASGASIGAPAVALIEAGKLSVSALIKALDDLFVAGGLRQAWPMALTVVNAACGATRKPAGLANLLATLATYAVEVPEGGVLPPQVAALAAGTGHSNAQVEARRFGAILTGTDPDTFLVKLRAEMADTKSVTAPRQAHVRLRGLWEAASPDFAREAHPSDVPADDLTFTDLQELRQLLSADFNYYALSYRPFCCIPPDYGSETHPGTALTYPDRVLAATVRAIGLHGQEAVRSALAGIERTSEPLHVVGAIDLWAGHGVDTSTFWRLARTSVTHEETVRPRYEDEYVPRRAAYERVQALPSLPDALSSPENPVQLPSSLDSGAARLAFLRALESLLLAEQNSVVLSTPTYADGTLDLEDLVSRLHTSEGLEVGPLDLVQALWRLRRVERYDADSLGSLAGLRTAPRLTDPGDAQGWDVCAVVGDWVAAGGLPSLDPVAVDGRWTTTVVAPVPWSRCEAAPDELRQDVWWIGRTPDLIRVMPRWADRVMLTAHAEFGLGYEPRDFPGRAAGPLGLALHDFLVGHLGQDRRYFRDHQLNPDLDVVIRGRLVPETAVAAALGRHEAGTLALGRVTQGVRTLFEAGGLRGLWPTAFLIAAALCHVDRRPAALPEFLRLLTAYAHEVPDRTVPRPLRDFAGSKGTTKGHLDARALVAALDATSELLASPVSEMVSG